jgi:hypothetical protein
MNLYTLRGKTPVLVGDLMTWAREMESVNCRVAHDTINGVEVSTVFLGLDHNFYGGPPLVFETMVFGGQLTGRVWRTSTWEEAEAGHASMVAEVRRTFIQRAG